MLLSLLFCFTAWGCVCVCVCVSLPNDKALQDVFSESALTPPIAFYGPEGEVCVQPGAAAAAAVTN